MKQEFDIAPMDLRRAWLLPGGILLAVFVLVAWVAHRDPIVLLVLSAELLLAALLIGYAFGRRRVAIEDGSLRVTAGIAQLRVAVSDLDPEAARIVDLEAEPALRPWLKLWGAATLGYRSGHFLLRDRRKAFVLLTANGQVLALPRRRGGLLLLSLRRPQALLEALHRMAKPVGAR